MGLLTMYLLLHVVATTDPYPTEALRGRLMADLNRRMLLKEDERLAPLLEQLSDSSWRLGWRDAESEQVLAHKFLAALPEDVDAASRNVLLVLRPMLDSVRSLDRRAISKYARDRVRIKRTQYSQYFEKGGRRMSDLRFAQVYRKSGLLLDAELESKIRVRVPRYVGALVGGYTLGGLATTIGALALPFHVGCLDSGNCNINSGALTGGMLAGGLATLVGTAVYHRVSKPRYDPTPKFSEIERQSLASKFNTHLRKERGLSADTEALLAWEAPEVAVQKRVAETKRDCLTCNLIPKAENLNVDMPVQGAIAVLPMTVENAEIRAATVARDRQSLEYFISSVAHRGKGSDPSAEERLWTRRILQWSRAVTNQSVEKLKKKGLDVYAGLPQKGSTLKLELAEVLMPDFGKKTYGTKKPRECVTAKVRASLCLAEDINRVLRSEKLSATYCHTSTESATFKALGRVSDKISRSVAGWLKRDAQ